jgi:SAM-dependent methyltransferase
MGSRDDIAAFFDANAGLYDPWFLADTYYLELLGAIVDRLASLAPAHIVELGCGTGNLTAVLGQRFPEASIVAVDVSRDSLTAASEKCARLPNVTVRQGDMLDAISGSAPGTSFVANYALHHLVDSEKELLCGRVARSLEGASAFVIGDVFHAAPADAGASVRARAILDLVYARAIYYLEVVGFARCLFEVEHLPLLLNNDREHLVERGFWSRIGEEHGLTSVVDEPVGPPELGNYLVELRSLGA